MKLLSLVLSLFILSACSPEIPNCSDPKVKEALVDLLSSKLVNFPSELSSTEDWTELNIQEVKESLSLQDVRPVAFDEPIKKYTCTTAIESQIKNPEQYKQTFANAGEIQAATKFMLRHNIADRNRFWSPVNEMLNGINAIYYSSDSKIKMNVNYTTQLLDGGKIFVLFDVNPTNLKGFQYSLIADKNFSNQNSQEQENDYDKLLNDLAPNGNTQIKLNAEDLNIISKMPTKFKEIYQSSGVLGLKTENNKCYEAASQLDERTLTVQCISFDAVACAIIPSIEKLEHYPREPHFTEEACFKRAKKASSSIYNNLVEQNEFINLVIQRSVSVAERYFDK